MSSSEFVYVPCGEYVGLDAGSGKMRYCTAENLCRYCKRIEQAWDEGYDEAQKEEEGFGNGWGNPYTYARSLGRSTS